MKRRTRLLTCGKPTRTGKIFLKKDMERELAKHKDEFLLCEYEPSTTELAINSITIQYRNVVCTLSNFQFEGNVLYADCEPLDNDMGKAFNSGTSYFGVRGLGKIDATGLVTDLTLITFDAYKHDYVCRHIPSNPEYLTKRLLTYRYLELSYITRVEIAMELELWDKQVDLSRDDELAAFLKVVDDCGEQGLMGEFETLVNVKTKKDNHMPKVFLGGTCNESDWRERLIKLLKIDYFNPVVDDWTEDCMAEEIKQRESCEFCLYVITPRMTGVYSIAEVIDDSNKRPEKTIFCFEYIDDGGCTFDDAQLKSLKSVGNMVLRNGGHWSQTLEDVANFLNNQ